MDSLHGRRHCLRTAAYAALLAGQAHLPVQEHIALVAAAAIHDCRRRHDKTDLGHGARAAEWFSQHSREVATHFNIDLTLPRLNGIETAVGLHDVPYGQFTHDQRRQHLRAEQLVDLLKAADALDRYRLPRLSWWPNPQLLRIAPPSYLYRFAFGLVTESEWRYITLGDSVGSVLTALPNWWRP